MRDEKKRVALCMSLHSNKADGCEMGDAGEETPFLMTKHINLSSEPRFFMYIRTHHQLSTPILHTRETFFVFKTPQQQQLECTHADSRFQETRESEANFSK